MQKKLPPYGSNLFNCLISGKKSINDVYIFIGQDAYGKVEDFKYSRPTTMCLPPGDYPERYFWPIQGCDILIFDTSNSSQAFIERFVICLFEYQANIVRYMSADNLLTVYKKDL